MKKKIFLFLIQLYGLSAFAQSGFEDHIVIDDTFGSRLPTSIYVADINGDGFLDIISTSSDEIVWYKNLDGLGNYSKQNLISTTPSDRLDVVDVDGDGFLDVLFTGNSNDIKGIYWCKNTDGLGTFSTPILISEETTFGNGQSDYQVIDYDNDKDVDILFVSYPQYGDTRLFIFKNDGTGNFKRSQLLSEALHFHATDVNGDNLPDLIAKYTNSLKVFIQKPDGTYLPEKIINKSSMEVRFSSGDIDNDGDIDIVSIYENGPASEDIMWYENLDGLGTFSPVKYLKNLPYFTSEFGFFYNGIDVSFCLKDMDSDAKIDIVFTYSVNNKIVWFKNMGAGLFGAEQIIASNSIRTKMLVTADLNKDGKNDVVAISRGENNIAWYKNNGLGIFSSKQNITTYAQTVKTIECGDLDGDGYNDIILLSDGNKISWYKNTNGLGDFPNQQLISVKNPYAYEIRKITTTDIDNDGDLDILYSFLDSRNFPDVSTISWLENDGSGNFQTEHNIITTKTNYEIILKVTDFNNDGKTDILWILDNDTVYILKNIGNGIFAEKELIPYNDHYSINSLDIQDIDQDGDNDIIICNSLKVSWFENDGQGNYTTSHILNIPGKGSSSLLFNDIDQDNDLDIFFKYQNKIQLYENIDGKGNFVYKIDIATSSYPFSSVYFRDIDFDGDQDIVGVFPKDVYFSSWYEKWYENKGLGKFEIEAEIPSEYKSGAKYEMVDINGDGYLDLIGSYFYDKITWSENKIPLGTLNTKNSTQTKVVCSGSANATASVSVSGGKTPYSYLWSNGATTSSITGLTAGVYSCTITDANYQVITKKFNIITEADTEKPSITAPLDITVNKNSNCTATGVILGSPITSDNCTVSSITNDAPDSFPIGNTTVTWTVKDASNNVATANQIITVKDPTPLTIKAPDAITLNTSSNCTAYLVKLGEPLTSDNCTITSITNNAPDNFLVGTTTVTWTVKDSSNNIATDTQIVTVKDATPPTIITPSNITVNTNSNCTATGVILEEPRVYDNCSILYAPTNDAPKSFPIGNTTVTWTVKDANNNISTATQIVTVKGLDLTITNSNGTLSVTETGAIYKWMTRNNNTFTVIPNEIKSTLTPTNNGIYAVEVTKNGCTQISDIINFNTLETEDFDSKASLKLSPNPTKDLITIEMNVSDKNQLKIFDINGQFILSKDLKTTSTTINISNLATGTYLFEISNELGSVTKKVVKN